MFVLLFALWLIFNGKITLDVVIIGIIVAGALYFFACRFMNFSIKKDITLVKEIPFIIGYILNLAVEIFKSTLGVTKLVLSKDEPHPALVKFHSGLKSRIARVLFANSITLTPGTISVSLKDDEYLVHALDKSMADGIEESSFVRILRKMEEVAGL